MLGLDEGNLDQCSPTIGRYNKEVMMAAHKVKRMSIRILGSIIGAVALGVGGWDLGDCLVAGRNTTKPPHIRSAEWFFSIAVAFMGGFIGFVVSGACKKPEEPYQPLLARDLPGRR